MGTRFFAWRAIADRLFFKYPARLDLFHYLFILNLPWLGDYYFICTELTGRFGAPKTARRRLGLSFESGTLNLKAMTLTPIPPHLPFHSILVNCFQLDHITVQCVLYVIHIEQQVQYVHMYSSVIIYACGRFLWEVWPLVLKASSRNEMSKSQINSTKP